MQKIQDIVIIGTGNVSWHLSQVLYQEGFNIAQIVGRDATKTAAFASRVAAIPITDFGAITPDAQLYILAVADDAIAQVAQQLPDLDGIVVHTSGSANINLLEKFHRFGVFYPLQTFTEGKQLNFEDIPILVEGNQNEVADILIDVARQLTLKTYRLNTAEREKLHIAAVFVCNFVNHMYVQGAQICAENQLPFDVLFALMQETTKKALISNPESVQTGPAIRGDEKTIAKHLAQITDTNHKLLYKTITDSIIHTHESKL